MKFHFFIVTVCLVLFIDAQGQNHKYELWKIPSYFRGFNVLPIATHQVQDYKDLKASGANLAQLSIDGFDYVDPPYDLNVNAIDATDSMVSYCNSAGIYYTIGVRSGPGRRDVWYEMEGGASPSTIWKNKTEQTRYAQMIKEIVNRYKDDTLFVGIGPIVEPNPLFQNILLYNAQLLKDSLESNGIDLKAINQLLIDEIRNADKEIPILIQNFKNSCPEFFAITDTFSDDFIVYEFHCYRPLLYASNNKPNTVDYPGDFFSLNDLQTKHFDKNFFKTNVFKYVDSIQKETGKPVFLGEFGLLYEQGGGAQLLNDIYEICVEEGWHFALWDYRAGRAGGGWDYENKSPEYWTTVLNMFKRIDWVEDIKSENNIIVIYPNPADDYLYMEITEKNINEKIDIYSMLGVKIKSITMENIEIQKIYVYDLPSGIYFVRKGKTCKTFFLIH